MQYAEYVKYDGLGLAELVRHKEVHPSELVEAAIARAQAVNPSLNFMVFADLERARTAAKHGVATGAFAGVPMFLKDILAFADGMPTRQGSRFIPAVPSKQDSILTTRFRRAGFVPLGKTNVPEFGMVPTTESKLYGPARNPFDLERSTGGSSGGSAAAVAAGVVPVAHANDGGGSIRIPSANCGLVGLKPSDGRMNDGDPNPDPLTLGVQGCVSRTVRDTAAFFAACEMQSGGRFPPVGLVTGPGTKKLKVGLITKGFAGNEAQTEVAAIVRATAKLMESLGHTIVETAWPTTATFQDDFLAYWSLGAANDMAEASKMLGKPVDE